MRPFLPQLQIKKTAARAAAQARAAADEAKKAALKAAKAGKPAAEPAAAAATTADAAPAAAAPDGVRTPASADQLAIITLQVIVFLHTDIWQDDCTGPGVHIRAVLKLNIA